MLKEYTDTEVKRPALKHLLRESRMRHLADIDEARQKMRASANTVQRRAAEVAIECAEDRVKEIDKELARCN